MALSQPASLTSHLECFLINMCILSKVDICGVEAVLVYSILPYFKVVVHIMSRTAQISEKKHSSLLLLDIKCFLNNEK